MNHEIISIQLQRTNQTHLFDENAIYGLLKIYYKKDGHLQAVILKTLENKKYTFPNGHYFIELQYSPKFARNLWEFTDIENRTEIKFHQGTHSSHSKGCILLENKSLYLLHDILKNSKIQTIHVK